MTGTGGGGGRARWSALERSLLDAILDELIPPGEGGIPGAGESGAAEFFPRASAYAPDPMGAARRVLAAARAKAEDFPALPRKERVALLRRVEAELPEDFAQLVRLAYMGYYGRPEGRRRAGVGAHPVHPGGYPVEPEDPALLDELTAPVRARGAAFRE